MDMDDVIEATCGALYLMADSSNFNRDLIKDLSMVPLVERLIEDHQNIDKVIHLILFISFGSLDLPSTAG